jgi:hypothetical protein
LTRRDLVLNCLFQSNQLKLYNNMIHGSGSGLLDRGLRRYTFLGGKADLLIFRGKQICLFLAPKWHLAV